MLQSLHGWRRRSRFGRDAHHLTLRQTGVDRWPIQTSRQIARVAMQGSTCGAGKGPPKPASECKVKITQRGGKERVLQRRYSHRCSRIPET